jgi:hypothetical protein
MFAAPTVKTIYKRKKRNVLDLFSVEGEGGYLFQNYTFMFKSSAFFNNNILASVKSIINPTRQIKSFTISGETYNYLDNILRISLGNQNVCAIFRDGTIDINQNTTSFPYIKDNVFNVRDTFTPSTYATDGTQFQQMLLMNNGDLVAIDCLKKTNKILLTGVEEFVTKNQGHRSDAMVGMKNGDLYHVWIGPTPVGSPYNDGNGTATGVEKINGIKYKDILFCTMGDPPAAATFCLKNDRKNIYRFIKGHGTDFKIKGVETTPIASMKLTDPTEYYVDGMSQEFNSLFLTNKNLIHKSTTDGSGNYSESYKRSEWVYGWSRNFESETPKIFARKIATPTAYTMIVEDIFGKFWFCGNSNYVMTKPTSYNFFDTLKTYLEPIRAAMK